MSTSRELPPLPEQIGRKVSELLSARVKATMDIIRGGTLEMEAVTKLNLELEEMIRSEMAAATADTARKCVEVCEKERKGAMGRKVYAAASGAEWCMDAIRSAFPAAFNQEQFK